MNICPKTGGLKSNLVHNGLESHLDGIHYDGDTEVVSVCLEMERLPAMLHGRRPLFLVKTVVILLATISASACALLAGKTGGLQRMI